VCLHEIQSRHALRVTCQPDTTTLLDPGAVARILLSYAPPEIQDEVLAGAPDARALRRDLRAVAADGIARSEGEPLSGVVAMAVPILREDGIVAAIGLLAPNERATLAWRTRAARLLGEGAASIAGSLGQ
jgi:DNA-binding IclR family transcriptional regulator